MSLEGSSLPRELPRSYEPIGLFGWFRHTDSRQALALATGILLLVAFVAAIVASDQVRRSRGEADRARSASAEWERRYEEERQSSYLTEKKHQDSEHDLATKLAQLRAELENERKQNTDKMAGDRDGSTKPQINIATLVLTSTRGSDAANSSPNQIVLSRSRTDFVISVSLEGDNQSSYRVTILDNRKHQIFKRNGFKRDPYNALSAEFPSTFFRQGDYTLTVDGVARDGSTSVVGTYSFRVVKIP